MVGNGTLFRQTCCLFSCNVSIVLILWPHRYSFQISVFVLVWLWISLLKFNLLFFHCSNRFFCDASTQREFYCQFRQESVSSMTSVGTWQPVRRQGPQTHPCWTMIMGRIVVFVVLYWWCGCTFCKFYLDMQNDANLKPQRHFNHHFGYLIMLNFWGRNGSAKINHLKSCVVVPLFPCLSCKDLRFDEHICHNGGRNPQHSFGHWVPKRNCKHHANHF